MNRLVEYMEKHHNPGGNAIKHVWVDDLLKESGWTRNEIFSMALEARDSNLLTLAMKTGFLVRDMEPEELDIIGIWNEVYKKMGI